MGFFWAQCLMSWVGFCIQPKLLGFLGPANGLFSLMWTKLLSIHINFGEIILKSFFFFFLETRLVNRLSIHIQKLIGIYNFFFFFLTYLNTVP
jgi:hypothetical protein